MFFLIKISEKGLFHSHQYLSDLTPLSKYDKTYFLIHMTVDLCAYDLRNVTVEIYIVSNEKISHSQSDW